MTGMMKLPIHFGDDPIRAPQVTPATQLLKKALAVSLGPPSPGPG